jgi:hypothetical protein
MGGYTVFEFWVVLVVSLLFGLAIGLSLIDLCDWED